jgi:hypothetical protein
VLSPAEIDRIAKEVAIQRLPPDIVDDVGSRPTLDSEGRDAVLITITLKSKTASGLSGELVLDTLVEIQHQLARRGEDRLKIVEYEETGESVEADDLGDSQS